MKKFALTSAAFLSLVFASSSAFAYFDICNGGSQAIYTTYTDYQQNITTISLECGSKTLSGSGCYYKAWRSRGWWYIEPGQCKRVLGSSITNRYQYVYAEVAGGGGTLSGPYSIKVRNPAFTYHFNTQSFGSSCIARQTFPNPCPPALFTRGHAVVDSQGYSNFVLTIN